jgi:hypothetical protein
MSPDRPTRRQLLGTAAAASLVAPGDGLAAALGPTVFSIRIGRLSGSSGELATRWRFVLAGVEWSGPRDASIELRVRSRSGAWSPWAVVSTLGHEPNGAPAGRTVFGSPVWFGPARRFELRASVPVDGLRVHFVTLAAVSGAPAAAKAAAFPLADPVLDAGPGQPPIIARSAWAGAHSPPAVPPAYGKVRLAFVHHTDNPNGYAAGAVPAILLAIYQFHRFVRGWHDIGYNFVIDLFGRIWEARAGGIDLPVIGAQAGGYNVESTGVAVLGTFSSVVPSRAAIAALERLLAWKLSLHGLHALGRTTVEVNPFDAFYTPYAGGTRISLPHVAGHRDGCTTDCPGNAFYARLPSIRPRVAALAGTVGTLTIGPRPPLLSLAMVETTAGVPAVVSGALRTLGAAPIAGAPVAVESVISGGTTTPLAGVTTTGDGSWEASFALEHSALVRAVHGTAPVTVSDLLAVNVAPAITLTVASTAPLEVTGTVRPAKRYVTITLYALQGPHRRRVASARVRVEQGGSFTAGLGARTPGSYELVARTRGDAVNVAGTSAPLRFTA